MRQARLGRIVRPGRAGGPSSAPAVPLTLPTFVASSTKESISATDTITLPTGTVAGDLLLIVSHNRNLTTQTGVTGSTSLFFENNGASGGFNTSCVYKVATAGDITAGTLALTGLSTQGSAHVCVAIRGAGIPLFIAKAMHVTGTITLPDITSSVATSLYFIAASCANDGTAFSYASGSFSASGFISSLFGLDESAGFGRVAGNGGTLTPIVSGGGLTTAGAAGTIEVPGV